MNYCSKYLNPGKLAFAIIPIKDLYVRRFGPPSPLEKIRCALFRNLYYGPLEPDIYNA